MLFSVSVDKMGAVWDVEVGARVKKLKGHSSYVNSCSASRRGPQMVATGSDDGTIRVSALIHVDYFCSHLCVFLLISYGIFAAGILYLSSTTFIR